jgi:hypothetical protein
MRRQPETVGAAFVCWALSDVDEPSNVLLSKGIRFGCGSASFPEVNHFIT